jgi:hypothetical protein
MNVNIIGNFDVVSYTGNISFQSSGKWYDYLTGDSITIASTSPSLTLQAGEYHIYTSKKLTPPNLTTSIDADFLNNFHHTVFPNPSKESIRFVFSLPESGSTQIRVLNLAGQVVAIPLEEAEMQGNELIEIKWDRNTPSGMRLPSGTYFYQIIHEGNIANGRFVLE